MEKHSCSQCFAIIFCDTQAVHIQGGAEDTSILQVLVLTFSLGYMSTHLTFDFKSEILFKTTTKC